jgi:prepilin-type N-terminal cleavage/methylation domain-containing protein
MMKHNNTAVESQTASGSPRVGYTLIELLVVVSILLVLAGITIASVAFTLDADRIRKGSSQLQSFLKGAQNRAVFTQTPVGVRLYLDDDFPDPIDGTLYGRTVSRITYIGPTTTWSAARDSGRVDLERIDTNGNGTWNDPVADVGANEEDILIVRGFNDPGWWHLRDRGFFMGDLRIRLPAGPKGTWYPFEFLDTEDIDGGGTLDTWEDTFPFNGVLDSGEDINGNGRLDTEDLNGNFSTVSIPDGPITTANPQQLLKLLLPYSDPGDNIPNDPAAHKNLSYEIELAWQVLPEEPCILPPGVVIDLDASKVPSAWRPVNNVDPNNPLYASYSEYMDIMFSPQGNVIGNAAGAGLIHLYVCDSEDSLVLKEQFVADLAGGRTAFDNDVADVTTGGLRLTPLDEVSATWVLPVESRPYVVKDRRLLSIFPQTGQISVSRVNAYLGSTVGSGPDSNSDGLADDPYRFAETGEEVRN